MGWDFRHHCPTSDAVARDGVAGVLYDRGEQQWLLVYGDDVEFDAWMESTASPWPLRFLDPACYAASVLIAFCPWCATPLAEDSAYLAWLRAPME